MATEVAELPDDAVAGVFRALPLRCLAVVRCVCKAWRDIVDSRALLLPQHLVPRFVRGVLINYTDHHHTHYFARPSSSSSSTTTIPSDGTLSFLPNAGSRSNAWSVLDHCNGLVLCEIESRGEELCVCNPATRRWTVLPCRRGADGKRLGHRYASAHIAFDPATSPHYHVILVPGVPEGPSLKARRRAEKERRDLLWEKERDTPLRLDLFFSLSLPLPLLDDDGAGAAFGEDELTEAFRDQQEFQQQQLSVDQVIDPCRFEEWPPTPWTLSVFSSRTGEWEERAFVREGLPAGTIEEMRLHLTTSYWTRWRYGGRYGVYHHGSLYMQCQGSFVTRISLSNNNYQVIETPANVMCTKPYLGKLQNNVCFGIIHGHQLKIWILNESCGQMEWLLKYEAEVGHYARYVASIPYDNSGRKLDGSWNVEENIAAHNMDHNVKPQSKESYEWDSDNDDTFTVDIESHGDSVDGHLDIMGFHPYKKVVFMVANYVVVAYDLNSTKIQHLGNSRPKRCYHGYFYGIQESFLYTPCMIGDLVHGEATDWSSPEDSHLI